MKAIKYQLEAQSKSIGFDKFGVVSLPIELRRDYYKKWISEGRHGQMTWMGKELDRRTDPSLLKPEAKSILCFGINYYQPETDRRGRIAKYALGADYHKVVLKKLKRICHWLQEEGYENRPYVDTGPLLEKPIAELAGLGWQGKNTILLNAEEGQWMFLGFILTTLELEPDKKQNDRCGSCTRCVDCCPTKAITSPYRLDATKCISYLTIEHKGAIPMEYRRAIGDHLFGCDDCLDVCPWNKWAKQTRETKFQIRNYPDLGEMLRWNEDQFNKTFAGTPIRRAKLNRWLRNVAIVLGNIGTVGDLPALKSRSKDPDPIISEHVNWAIEEIKSRTKADEPEPIEIPIDGTLDLHHFRPAEVKEVVLEYIEVCHARNIRNLRIIHGKGKGVLRTQVHALLNRSNKVKHFQIAGSEAGHWGATWVTLNSNDANKFSKQKF